MAAAPAASSRYAVALDGTPVRPIGDMTALLSHPHLWRARHLPNEPGQSGHATGFAALDDALHDGGWPVAGLMELLCATHGIGELRLLMPALARLSQAEARWIVWVTPPCLPYAPALLEAGVMPGKVLLVRPQCQRDALWAAEKALKSGAACAVLAWLAEPSLEVHALRRLQLAAQEGQAWGTLFRPAAAANRPSMAELRILVESERSQTCDRLAFSVLKRRGGWAGVRTALKVGQAPIRYGRERFKERLAKWLGTRRSASTVLADNAASNRGAGVRGDGATDAVDERL